MNSVEPAWLTEARAHIGVREIPGVNHHPMILRMWRSIRRGGIKDDETPWCAAFVGYCLEHVGIVSSRFESARSYMDWGRPLPGPAHGCIVVLGRVGGGHVGFLTGVSAKKELLILGGNQGNEVNIRAFPTSRVLGYRWPIAVPLPRAAELMTGTAPQTTGES